MVKTYCRLGIECDEVEQLLTAFHLNSSDKSQIELAQVLINFATRGMAIKLDIKAINKDHNWWSTKEYN
jgi:hypothetical protein